MINMGKEKARQYQWDAFNKTANHIRSSADPALIVVATGGGKSCIAAMLAKRCDDVGMKMLLLARQGELVEQDSDWMWRLMAKNSIFSASLNKKSKTFGIICGTEGTVVNALHYSPDNEIDLSDFVADIIVCDEAHQVPIEDLENDEPKTKYGKIITEFYNRNPKLRVIGLTGSPFRGVEPIVGKFWKKEIINISERFLTDNGYLKPVIFGFGHDDVEYDLSSLKHSSNEGIRDYSAKELQEMESLILSSETTTHKIMREVESVMSERGGVALVTCAGRKHCEEAAKNLNKKDYGIITTDTTDREREQILKKAKNEEIKYLFQIGCLTTGIDIPAINTIVILRNIGSLTLLVQLIGRGLRPHITDDEQRKEFFGSEEHEVQKRLDIIAVSASPDCLVLDYSGTMHEMGELYQNPILEQAELQRARQNKDLITCPSCGTENSPYARRCIGESLSSTDKRCEFFWQSRKCESCGTENDTAARECRSCNAQLIDPNAKLTNKHYTENDYINVLRMDMRLTSNGEGVLIEYYLENGDKATEVYWPHSKNKIAKKMWIVKFVYQHVNGRDWQKRVIEMKSAAQIVKMKAVFNTPSKITHRRNDKGKSIIHKKIFLSGREVIESES